MSDDKRKLGLDHQQAEDTGESREVYLREGRTLTVSSQGADELVEVRAASGNVELRILLTEQGPVLQLEAVRLKLKATESVEVEAKQVSLKAQESLALGSDGDVKVTSAGETTVEAEGDVRVAGKSIHLN
jgi:hypothetical protein